MSDYLAECRCLTLESMRGYLPRQTRHTGGLYDLMLDYPLRPAKALRPALCLAACRALGGQTDQALPSATALELFHNAFLLHDDVEDGARQRRHLPALHVEYGASTAINVGDGLLAFALQPLLGNVEVIGLGPSLRVLDCISRMARESVEGQMLELNWIRQRRWAVSEREYLRMVHKKTGWYSFIAPVQLGAIAARAPSKLIDALGRFAMLLGIAFQIQDDLLSLDQQSPTGKDALGDLWEGKCSLALLHALRVATDVEREQAIRLLALPRAPLESQAGEADERTRLFDKIRRSVPELTPHEVECLRAALGCTETRASAAVAQLHAFVWRRGGESMQYARRVALRYARRAQRVLEGDLAGLQDSLHRRFLFALVQFVTDRRT